MARSARQNGSIFDTSFHGRITNEFRMQLNHPSGVEEARNTTILAWSSRNDGWVVHGKSDWALQILSTESTLIRGRTGFPWLLDSPNHGLVLRKRQVVLKLSDAANI